MIGLKVIVMNRNKGNGSRVHWGVGVSYVETDLGVVATHWVEVPNRP